MNGEGNGLQRAAVWNLRALGLSEYAARTLVALTRIGGGSAREVSETSSVPRTRVYDAVDELSDRGFVRVRESHPKVFEPVVPRRIRRTFYREYVFRQVVAEWGLQALGPADTGSGEAALDVETDSESLRRRFLAAIDDADERVTYVAAVAPCDDVLAALDEVADRDVTVRILCVGGSDVTRVEGSVTGATVLSVPDATAPSGTLTRLLLVDESTAALGTRCEGDDRSAEIGLFGRVTDSEVGVLLRQLVDTLITDAA